MTGIVGAQPGTPPKDLTLVGRGANQLNTKSERGEAVAWRSDRLLGWVLRGRGRPGDLCACHGGERRAAGEVSPVLLSTRPKLIKLGLEKKIARLTSGLEKLLCSEAHLSI